MNLQDGKMSHLAAEPRYDPNRTPDLSDGRPGLFRSLASWATRGPSTTWVPPSDRHPITLTNRCVFASFFLIL